MFLEQESREIWSIWIWISVMFGRVVDGSVLWVNSRLFSIEAWLPHGANMYSPVEDPWNSMLFHDTITWLNLLLFYQYITLWLSYSICPCLFVYCLRICLEQGFVEGKRGRKRKIGGSNGPELLDSITFPIPYKH